MCVCYRLFIRMHLWLLSCAIGKHPFICLAWPHRVTPASAINNYMLSSNTNTYHTNTSTNTWHNYTCVVCMHAPACSLPAAMSSCLAFACISAITQRSTDNKYKHKHQSKQNIAWHCMALLHAPWHGSTDTWQLQHTTTFNNSIAQTTTNNYVRLHASPAAAAAFRPNSALPFCLTGLCFCFRLWLLWLLTVFSTFLHFYIKLPRPSLFLTVCLPSLTGPKPADLTFGPVRFVYLRARFSESAHTRLSVLFLVVRSLSVVLSLFCRCLSAFIWLSRISICQCAFTYIHVCLRF